MLDKLSSAKASPQTPSVQPSPQVEVAIGSDELNRRHVLVTVDDQKALLSAGDLMQTPQKLAQQFSTKGVFIFSKDTCTEIMAAAEATAKATSNKPTFQVALVPGWHRPPIASTADLYLHGSTMIGNKTGVFVDPALLLLGDRPRKFETTGKSGDWRQFVESFVVGQPLLTFLFAAAFASMILKDLVCSRSLFCCGEHRALERVALRCSLARLSEVTQIDNSIVS
jgi:hypothetical protein